MRKAICVLILAASSMLAVPATALPIAPMHPDAYRSGSDIIEVKGGHGHGHGHGHGWGRGHGHRAFGWSRGRKVGWHHHHCPPGQWKKGRC